MSGAGEFERTYRATVDSQLTAADPRLSAWVGASAGSGKTKVLSDRVLRLLLAEGEPTRILCLTFTKAAAAEMERRITERLADWTARSAGELEKELADLLDARPTLEEMAIARSLFARMLDAPGGLKIQTIHSFCQSLLARFPLEAGVTPNFETLDERSALEKLGEAREEVLGALPLQGVTEGVMIQLRPLAEMLPDLVTFLSEGDFGRLVNQLITQRGRLRGAVERLGGLDYAGEVLYQRLGLTPGLRPETVAAQAGEIEEGLRQELLAAADLLSGSGKNDQAAAQAIRHALAQTAWDSEVFFGYCKAFLTDKGERRAQVPAKKIKEDHKPVADLLDREAARLQVLQRRYHAALEARLSLALLRMAYHTLEVYERLKKTAAALDYDDQIGKARGLLAAEGLPSWVLFKLDGGLDHLLVDEAQDTSPEQWDVIGALVEEFFSGEGAAEERREKNLPPRSLFTVGDPKQSIYGFQGAAPELFAKKREEYERKALNAGVAFRRLPLDMSFRSTDAVLKAVDAVFAPPEKHKGVVFDEDWRPHTAFRNGHAGSVELWPTLDPAEDPDSFDPWQPAEKQYEADAPRRRLAELLARRIWRWTKDPASEKDPDAQLESQGRRLEAGDIMVLVRRRNAFVTELVRELKQRGVAVAGVDRMKLLEQLPVMDLVALGQVLLLPEDDLTLAAVLKSPLIGVSEEDLFELAHDRKGASLWERLRRKSGEKESFAKAWAFLEREHAREGFESAYRFYARVLGENRGRAKMLARLGQEAADPLDEFLALAQDYARLHPPSLQGFLHWLVQDDREVKRDLEQTGGAVRIMTVHAAKGLQAPLVILPDTLGAKRTAREMLWSAGPEEEGPGEGGKQGGPALPLLRMSEGQRSGLADAAERAARERDSQEKRRLLYVAMTRAEDRLIVCGWRNKRDDEEEAWYSHLADAFDRLAEDGEAIEELPFEEPGLELGGSLRRLSSKQEAEPRDKREREAEGAAPAALPPWARSGEAPVEPTPPKPLQPSRPSGPEPASLSPLGKDQGWRFKRGNLIHRLLQTLPDLPEGEWEEAAARYLSQPVNQLSSEETAALTAETLGVLRAPEMAGLFGPDSRAEVPLSGVIGASTISGQVDRLLIGEGEIKVIDYKTNRPAPEREEAVPAVYLRQMASYRALLEKIYPGRTVTCYLLWTEAPRLMPLAGERLDAFAP